jgi:hypothetical protein
MPLVVRDLRYCEAGHSSGDGSVKTAILDCHCEVFRSLSLWSCRVLDSSDKSKACEEVRVVSIAPNLFSTNEDESLWLESSDEGMCRVDITVMAVSSCALVLNLEYILNLAVLKKWVCYCCSKFALIFK